MPKLELLRIDNFRFIESPCYEEKREEFSARKELLKRDREQWKLNKYKQKIRKHKNGRHE